MRSKLIILLVLIPIALHAQNWRSANPAWKYAKLLEYPIIPNEDHSAANVLLPDGLEVNVWDFYNGVVGLEYSYCRAPLKTYC